MEKLQALFVPESGTILIPVGCGKKKNNQRKTKNSLSKSVSAGPTINQQQQPILEEPNIAVEEGININKNENELTITSKSVWTSRKQPYNNRRKSTDFSNIGEQRSNNKVCFSVFLNFK